MNESQATSLQLFEGSASSAWLQAFQDRVNWRTQESRGTSACQKCSGGGAIGSDFSHFCEQFTVNNGDEFVQLFRIYGLSIASKAIARAYADNYDDIMSGSFVTSIYNVSDAQDFIRASKGFVRKRVHANEKVLQLELMGRRVIHGLMSAFYEAVDGQLGAAEPEPEPKEFRDKVYLLLSKNYRQVFIEDLKKKHSAQYCRCKLVTDYVCGMTDTFACSVHKQIGLGQL